MKKLVIAYSGGLDTSYCAVSLSKKYEVHAVSVNTGGFSVDEIKKIEKNAYKMGVENYKNIDAVATFYQKQKAAPRENRNAPQWPKGPCSQDPVCLFERPQK